MDRSEWFDPPPISRPFRFKEMWLTDRGCDRKVEAVWRNHTPWDAEVQVMRKVVRCGKELTQWSRKNFRSVR